MCRRLFGSTHIRNISWLIKVDDVPQPYSVILLKHEIAEDSLDDIDVKFIETIGATITSVDLPLRFENRSLEWLLSHYLPHIPNVINSFETVGHIAHMNLRGDDMLEAKHIIGAIVLEVRRILPISRFNYVVFRANSPQCFNGYCFTEKSR